MEPLVHVAAFEQLAGRTAYLLWRLRESVFVVEQNCPYLELDGRDLEEGTRHLWVEVGAEPVACLRVLTEPDETCRIGRVAVAEPMRGHGLAGALMTKALEVVGDRASVLDAQAYLADWYTGFGYRVVGTEFVEDGIPHVPMARQATPGV